VGGWGTIYIRIRKRLPISNIDYTYLNADCSNRPVVEFWLSAFESLFFQGFESSAKETQKETPESL
jgi:hypothetical protein